MIPCLTFTHSGGRWRLPWWVKGVRQAGLLPVVVDDVHDPLDASAVVELRRDGVEYRRTTWRRRGNLNGTDVAAGICEELAAAAKRYGSAYALKCDDDTAIIEPGLFTPAATCTAVGLTWAGDPRGGAYGMAYALRRDVAAAVAHCLRLLPLDPAAPEDLTVWGAVRAMGRDQVIEHEFDPIGGPFCALPIGADPREAVRRFGVVTVGNRPPEGWRDKPVQTAARLRQVVCTARAEALRAGCLISHIPAEVSQMVCGFTRLRMPLGAGAPKDRSSL